MSRDSIGLIGVGLLGTAMSQRLLESGFAVIGFDADASRQAALSSLGGQPATSTTEVANQCTRVLLSLPDDSVVDLVVDSLKPELKTGTLLIDTTTGDPDVTAQRGRELAEAGIGYVDATVAGSSQQLLQKDVIVMIGGSQVDVARCADILESFARQTFHVGPCGSGARMKLVVNLAIGLNRAVLAEALAFARLNDLDLQSSLQVLKASPSYSRMMDTKGDKMLSGDFRPQARLAQHLKDVHLILKQAAERSADLPLTKLHEQMLQSLVDRGYGHLDNSAVFKAYE